MTPNPYEPPRASAAEPPREGAPVDRLFGAVAVAVHVLVFPVAGALMAVNNYARLRDGAGTCRSLLLFVAPAAALLWLAVSPHGRSQGILMLAGRVPIAALAFVDQRPIVAKHLAAGGRKARWYLAWFLILPLMMLFLALWQVLSPAVRH